MSSTSARATVVLERPDRQARPRPSTAGLRGVLTSARGLGVLSVSCIGGATALAALAGKTMVAWWTIACLVPLVTPVTFAYALELTIYHGLLIVPIIAAVGILLGLAALGRASAALDEL